MPILNYRDLQNINEQRQSGVVFNDNAPITNAQPIEDQDWDKFYESLEEEASVPDPQRLALDAKARDAYSDYVRGFGEPEYNGLDDYGAFRKDTEVPYHEWIQDPVNYRAHSQTEVGKLANGFAKLVPYAATTFLDNTVGLAAGITNVLGDAFDGEGGFHPVNSFIDTPFAESMQRVRDWSEQTFPNYRTQEELDDQDQWWKHLNANFWGDTFIKNLGFTLGAAASGALYAKGFQAMSGKIMRDAYRAAVAASVEGDAAAEAAFQRVLQGARQDVKSIYTTFNSIHDSYRKMSAMSQIIGGIGGAIGESRMEAMMAAKEARDKHLQEAGDTYDSKKAQLAQEILNNSEYNSPSGLTEAGQEAWRVGLEDISKEYGESVDAIDKEATDVANSVFWMNMPLLTATNMVMFGRLFSGGYKSQAKRLVNGAIGNYTPKGSIASDVVRGVKNTLSEGMEELSQKIFSEGAKDIADTNMAAFHNGKYDIESIRTVSDWLLSMSKSAGNVVADPTSWEEFAVGALTGAIGMPSRSGWSGGLIGAFQEGKQEREDARKYANELNALSKDKLKTLYGGLVRHTAAETAKEKALASNDSFTWHTKNDEQILNSVMTFANAGVLNDLEEYIDSFSNIKEEDISRLRSSFVDDGNLDFQNMNDAQVLDWVKKRVGEVKRSINQYRDFYDSVDFLSLGTTDKEVIDELVYTRSQLENFENRYNEILDNVIANIRPTIEQVAQEKKQDGTPTQRAEYANKLLQSESEMRRLFGGYALDIKARAEDNANNPVARKAVEVDDARQRAVIEELNDWGAFTKDPELKEQVKDLQKLVRSRQNYYAKLYDPSFRQKMEKDAVKPEDAAKKIIDNKQQQKEAEFNAQTNAELGGADTVPQMRDVFNKTNDKTLFVDTMRKRADKNDVEAKKFVELYDTYNDFRKVLFEKHPELISKNTGSFNLTTDLLLNQLFDQSNSAQELVNNLTEGKYDLNAVSQTLDIMVQNDPSLEGINFPVMVTDYFNKTIAAINAEAEGFQNGWKTTSDRQNLSNAKLENQKDQPRIDDNANPDAATKPDVKLTVESESAEKNKNVPTQEAIPEKQEDNTPEPISVPEESERASDANSTYRDNSVPEQQTLVQDKYGSVKYGSYGQSIPEIPTQVAREVRDLLLQRKGASREELNVIDAQLAAMDMSDFVVYNENGEAVSGETEYAETYKWLKDNGAFEYISTKLKPGDDVVLAIMEGAPKYEERNQIVVAAVKSRNEAGEIAELQPLTILHSTDKGGDYMNLDALYDAIYEDYDSTEPSGGLYVFGGKKNPKMSKVWGKRPGLVRYDRSNPGTRIDRIDSYDDSAPIMVVGENNQPVLLRGNIDVSKIYMPNIYEWSPSHYGRLYYLTKSGDDGYTPILIDKQNITTADLNNAPEGSFIYNIRQELISLDNISAGLKPDNIEQSNISLKKKLGELNEYLNLDGLTFEYVDEANPHLNIKWNVKDEVKGVNVAPDESIIPLFDNVLSRPARLSPKEKWLDSSKRHLEGIIESGLLTSNVRELRQVGVNFMFDPWDSDTGTFKQILSSRRENNKSAAKAEPQVIARDAELGNEPLGDEAVVSDETISKSVEVHKTSLPENLTDFFEDKGEDVVVPQYELDLEYSQLSAESRDTLKQKGVSEKVWDESDEKTREHLLYC